jgi:hypothetical protein
VSEMDHAAAQDDSVLKERLLARVVVCDDGCWSWQGARNSRGYGEIWVNGACASTHRLAWTIFRGAIPSGMYVCHLCDHSYCCNPDHLFLGTPRVNVWDSILKRRRRMQLGRAEPPFPKGVDVPLTFIINWRLQWPGIAYKANTI